jgi:protease-4
MSEVHEGGNSSSVESTVQTVVIYLIVIAIAVVGSYYLAQALIPTPKIGVIELVGPVGSITEDVLSREVAYARDADDIRGVLLIVNSPGGSASAGHDIYYQFRKLRETKPIVASMDILAASAAYQIAVAANEIYAKPASIVGNIGVIFSQPSPEVLSEQFTTTGPFKSTGGSATSYLQMLDLLHADFRDSVVAERTNAPNPLKLAPDEVATGEIWVGIQAKELGIIDEIGSRLDATDAVARLANIENYEVVSVREQYLASLEGPELTSALAIYEKFDTTEVKFDLSAEETEWPSFYQLYVPVE